MYIGAATEEAPTPTPPMNLKKENVYGSVASADPRAEIEYKIPIQNKVFLRPNLSQGIPPNNAPNTVPHNAIDMMKVP